MQSTKSPLDIIVSILFLLLSISISIYTLIDQSIMKRYFIDYSYYLILTTFIIWLIITIKFYGIYSQQLKHLLHENWKGIVFCFVLAALLFFSVPAGFRVLADETNIVSVSKSMVFNKKVNNELEGYWYYGNFWALDKNVIDKRPLLVPFLASIIHTLTGYRPENVFIVNFLMVFSLLSMIYIVSRKYLNTILSISIVIILTSQPILSILENAGGLELTSTVFLLLVLGALFLFLKNPSSLHFAFLWVNTLMYLHTRYEAAAPVIVMCLLLLIFRQINWQYIKDYLWIYTLSFLILLPLLWQRILVYEVADELPLHSAIIPFSWRHILEHTFVFSQNLFDFSLTLPYANIVNWMGVIGIIYLFILFINQKDLLEKYQKKYVWTVFFVFLTLWLITTSYYGMKPDQPSSFRVYLPFIVLLSVISILLICQINAIKQRPIIILMFSITCFLIYVPIAIENRFTNYQTIVRDYNFVSRFLEKVADKNILLIHERPNLFTVHNYGAISFERANREVEEMLFRKKRHLFKEIYVVQLINYKTLLPEKGQELSGFYKLEATEELQCDVVGFLRISRVVNLFQN